MERARDAADRLGLTFEHRHTGLGELETSIVSLGRGIGQDPGRYLDESAVASTGPAPAGTR